MKITPISLPTVFGMKTVNAFLLQGNDEVALVDTGEWTAESMTALKAGLKEEKLELTDIDRIIITHAHVDHIGMAQKVSEFSGAKVWVSDRTKSFALDPIGQWGLRKKLILGTIRSFFPKSMHAGAEANYLSFSDQMQDVWLPIEEDRLEFYDSEGDLEMCGEKWQSIYMPGHSNTQSTFYLESTGEYIAADMLLKISSTPVIEGMPGKPNEREKGILTMLESYKRLSTYDLKTVYPGHYEVFDDGNRMIDIHLNRIRGRVEQCMEIIKKSAPAPISFLNLFLEMYKGRWHMPALVMQIGYLDILENEGRIKFDDSKGYKEIVAI